MAVKTQEYKKGVPAKYTAGLSEGKATKQAAEIKSTAETVKKAKEEGRELSGDYYDMIAKQRMGLVKGNED